MCRGIRGMWLSCTRGRGAGEAEAKEKARVWVIRRERRGAGRWERISLIFERRLVDPEGIFTWSSNVRCWMSDSREFGFKLKCLGIQQEENRNETANSSVDIDMSRGEKTGGINVVWTWI